MQSLSGMTAGELCVRDVVTASLDESVIDAARRMAALHAGDVVVVSGASGSTLPHPIGIVTDRDLVVRVLAEGRDPATTPLDEIMQHDLVIAREDDTVEHVLEQMREHAVRRVPIVDRAGGLQGVLSLDDLVGWMRDQLQAATILLERQGQGPLLHARATR